MQNESVHSDCIVVYRWVPASFPVVTSTASVVENVGGVGSSVPCSVGVSVNILSVESAFGVDVISAVPSLSDDVVNSVGNRSFVVLREMLSVVVSSTIGGLGGFV